MNNLLGDTLQKLRKEKKLSLRAVGEITGLSYGYIRDIEIGINRKTDSPMIPTPDTLRKFAQAYDYPYQDLMRIAGHLEDASGHLILDDPNISDENKELFRKILDLPPDQYDLVKNIINNFKNEIK